MTRMIVGVSAAMWLMMSAPCATAQEAAGQARAEPPLTPFQEVEVRGRGPVPMVLIPDIGFDISVWSAFMDRNAERYTMYAVTLPGCGGTSAPDLPQGALWEDMILTRNAVRAIAHFITTRAIDRPVLVGHGYGGHLAMKAALEHPDLARAVVSINGLPVQPLADPNQDPDLNERKEIIRRSVAPNIIRLSDEEWKARQFNSVTSLVSDDFRARDLAEVFNRTDRGVATFYFLESILSDIRGDLKNLNMPLLCIAPIAPQPVPPASVIKAVWTDNLGAPPNAALTFYPDCLHFVMDDNPAQLDQDLALFVAGKDVPGAMRSIKPLPPEERPVGIPKYTPPVFPPGR